MLGTLRKGILVGVAVSGQNAGRQLIALSARSGVPDWLSGGAFGLEGNLVTCLVLLVRDYHPSSTIEKRKLLRLSSKTRSFYFCVKIEETLGGDKYDS